MTHLRVHFELIDVSNPPHPTPTPALAPSLSVYPTFFSMEKFFLRPLSPRCDSIICVKQQITRVPFKSENEASACSGNSAICLVCHVDTSKLLPPCSLSDLSLARARACVRLRESIGVISP